MEIHETEKRILLSVGAFANFGSSDAVAQGISSTWRMETGRIWHEEMQQAGTAQFGEAISFEKSITGMVRQTGWTFELNGRMDQVLTHDEGIEIREVKSTQTPLPEDPETLKAKYPHYFTQAACYHVLHRQQSPEVSAKTVLIFVNIDDGITQTVPIDDPEDWIEAQCRRLLPFLEAKVKARKRCLSATFNLPFETLRPGQAEARAELLDYRPDTRHRIFQAPTGFGKTGIALEFALTLLQRGEVERIVFLTGKTSGQLQACRQLETMLAGSEDPPLTLQLRNKEDHHRGLAAIPEPPEDATIWDTLTEELPHRFEKGFLDLETIQEMGEQLKIDPFEITRKAIAYADILVADYNYVFAPTVRGFLESTLGWEPSKTFLIIDEAHNLTNRARIAWSQEIAAADIDNLRDHLFFNNQTPKLQHACDDLAALIRDLPADKPIQGTDLYALKDSLESIKKQIQDQPLPWDEFPDAVAFVLNNLLFTARVREYATLPYLLTKRSNDAVTWNCIDAAPEIGLSLDAFASTVSMSATIGQPDLAAEAFGIFQHLGSLQWIEAEATWRNDAYTVAIDSRVDTRMKARDRSYQTTAETIAALAESASTPAVAFFSSYRYAEAVQTYLETLFPYLRITLQERGLTFDYQEAFLQRAVDTSDILLLILGSSFSEGIDVLGGQVETAIVVGPALPEMSLTQEAVRKNLEKTLSKEEAFERSYIVPGMQKINQALGRIVRSPEHRAKIILQGKRFLEPAYQKHLDPVYTSAATTIRKQADLANFVGQ